uniref:Uncharacterized protein n=1 Tax=Ralstonia syzygii R24 TaxID=907261 RepID=G3A9Q8_9RALS|nr:conserved hypothetical protein [Ralstonia syzygii R24]
MARFSEGGSIRDHAFHHDLLLTLSAFDPSTSVVSQLRIKII